MSEPWAVNATRPAPARRASPRAADSSMARSPSVRPNAPCCGVDGLRCLAEQDLVAAAVEGQLTDGVVTADQQAVPAVVVRVAVGTHTTQPGAVIEARALRPGS